MTRAPRVPGASLLSVLLVLTTGACLPRGEPPAGRQILADKTAVLTDLIPDNGDGLVRVAFFRPGKDADNVNLWVVTFNPDDGTSTEKMLFADIDTGFELGYRPSARNAGFPMDAQGRLYFYRSGPAPAFMTDVVRADPVTGEVVDLGQPPNVAQPTDASQYPTVNNYTGGPVVFAANGGATVSNVASYGFGGSTAFYLTTDGTLISLDPAGAARQLATGLATFLPLSAERVLITRAAPDTSAPGPSSGSLGGPPPPPGRVTGALLDTATLVETPLPDGFLYQYSAQPSPSGRWLLVSQESSDPNQLYGSNVRGLVDTWTGTVELLESTFSFGGIWRPRHDELWTTAIDDPEQTGLLSGASLQIKKPGLPVVTVPGVYFTNFSDDGTSWFSRGTPLDVQASSDLVGVADDPSGPRFPAVPAGSSLVEAWSLGDGRILDDSEVGVDSFENALVQMVDPRNGATQPVGELGFLSVVGKTGALGIYHVTYLRGDLTTTDFATGRSTVLAAEFAMSAVAQPQGADLYPRGGRIVYQFGAHYDSPWNGLWMATVP